jgi:hypothetical protein
MGKERTYYVVHNPVTCSIILDTNPEPPIWVYYGYYISGCSFEPENIKFKGSYKDCRNVVISLLSFCPN